MQIHKPILQKIFPGNYQLIDGTDEIFELDLALWEYETLSKEELISRSAYFKAIDGKETAHFKTCNLHNLEDVHKNSSFRTKVFFLDGKYSTGYATHGLFPYRGKFHPQLIRSLLNILEIKPGNIVLDPMAGSATVSVEAALLGIDSISVDFNPFCELIGRVKIFALNLDAHLLKTIVKNQNKLLTKLNMPRVSDYFINKKNDEKRKYYEIILLAFLDSMGFARRSNSSIDKLFPRVLDRYISTIINFQEARQKLDLKIGSCKILNGSVLNLPIEKNSIDAIITSPPYSFAIDYLKNDQPQLEYLGYDINSLRDEMIGLKGRGIENRLEIYFSRMNVALKEMRRVSKRNAPIVIIIGTNDIQTKGVRLETKIIELAENQNLKFELQFIKPIKGLQNTMKNESILFFKNLK